MRKSEVESKPYGGSTPDVTAGVPIAVQEEMDSDATAQQIVIQLPDPSQQQVLAMTAGEDGKDPLKGSQPDFAFHPGLLQVGSQSVASLASVKATPSPKP